jgi:hypothetical protein
MISEGSTSCVLVSFLRGDHGDLTVMALSRDPGVFRVYNMSVEADHVYYVGDFGALTHNTYKNRSDRVRKSKRKAYRR